MTTVLYNGVVFGRLRIDLDQPNKPYGPGDTIKGTVKCIRDTSSLSREGVNRAQSTLEVSSQSHASAADQAKGTDLRNVVSTPAEPTVEYYGPSAKETAPQTGGELSSFRLCITLFGHAKSKIVVKQQHSQSTYRARCPLVRMEREITLLQSFVDSQENGSFSFSFQIPETVQDDLRKYPDLRSRETTFGSDYWTHDFKSAEGGFFNAPGPSHYLPPTIKVGPRGVSKKGEGFVEYEIMAALLFGARSFSTNAETADRKYQSATTQRHFWMTTRKHRYKDYAATLEAQRNKTRQILTWQTLDLLPQAEREALTKTKRFKHLLKPSSVPTARFQMHVDIPRVVAVGEKLEFKFRAEPAALNDKEVAPPDPPDLRLVYLTVALHYNQGLRNQGGAWRGVTDDWGDTIFTKKIGCEMGWSSGEPKEKGQTEMGKELVGWIPIPERVVPTFKTYNLWRTHSLRYSAGFECVGKTFAITRTVGITVIAKPKAKQSEESEGENKQENWGAYRLEAEERLLSQSIAGGAMEVVGLASDVLNVLSNLN